MPLLAALLLETLFISRRKAWKKQQAHTGNPVPKALWLWGPIGSASITRRQQLWAVPDWEDALELHMVRLEAIRRLHRAFGWFWFWKVPAHVAVRLRKGFRVHQATVEVDAILNEQQETKQEKGALPALPELPAARDPKVFEEAVEYYVEAIRNDVERPSERGLCSAFDVPTTNRRWAKQVKKAAEARVKERKAPTSRELQPVPA
ncbi:hypothetical protein [Nocardiopsis sp. FIRDI 009]|uniref:hypothetical protein n=1 Tax=Nocardiopsis sp. FIRDI 009 TaxID=714197 RepID=UPI000E261F35|nr:hypothetical protein [Nocardiopsis sp. FIRDI 009]